MLHPRLSAGSVGWGTFVGEMSGVRYKAITIPRAPKSCDSTFRFANRKRGTKLQGGISTRSRRQLDVVHLPRPDGNRMSNAMRPMSCANILSIRNDAVTVLLRRPLSGEDSEPQERAPPPQRLHSHLPIRNFRGMRTRRSGDQLGPEAAFQANLFGNAEQLCVHYDVTGFGAVFHASARFSGSH
jgi:hypothetical protein